MRDIRNRLEEKVGVKPSEQWLAACQSFLQETNQEATSDAILHQILHCDLRDVVRPITTTQGETTTSTDASKRLTAAIEASLPNSHNSTMPAKQVLDTSFRLLVQVEELLDVSLNAESRLAVGPASSNAPTPVGNQQKRCLKLCMSDGYLPTPIIAMEVTPIPSMSVQTKAGVKVVLQGPIEIRFGVLMCHPGNATVLGGSVQELAEIQQRALEQAKQVAGVGVDPTIRALIGNTPQALDDEEGNDEGEEASRDIVVQVQQVVAPQQPAPAPVPMPMVTQQQPPPPSQHHQTPLMPPPPARSVVPIMGSSGSNNNNNNNNNNRSSTGSANPYASSSQRSTSSSSNPYASINSIAPSSNTPTATTTQPRATNPYSSQSSTTAATNNTTSNPYQSSASRTPTASSTMSTNPYAAHSSASTATSATTPANPYQRQSSATPSSSTNQPPTASSNPYASSSNRDSMTLTPPSTAAIPMDTTHDDSMDLTPPGTTTTSATTPNTTNSAASSSAASSTTTTPSSTPPQIMTYANLHKLLSQLLSNPEMYKTFQDVTFEVPLQQKGGDLHFNIVKKKKSKRKKKSKDSAKNDKNDKYEYLMSATFGSLAEDVVVRCEIPSHILEPYFGQPPGDLRQLSRMNRSQSHEIVTAGGSRVRQTLFDLRTWYVTLAMTVEELEAVHANAADGEPCQLEDGTTAILMIQPK